MLGAFEYRQGELFIEELPVRQLVKKFGTPTYLYSSRNFLTPLTELKTSLSDPVDGVDFAICFAMKACSNLGILKLLKKQNVGVDIVSGGELFRASKVGMNRSQIVFSGVGKTDSEIKAALQYQKKGIFAFNVESLPELQRLGEIAKRLKRKAPVALRFNPDIDAQSHPYISTGLKEDKFGITEQEILSSVQQLASSDSSNSLNSIRIQGLSIHIGSQILTLEPLQAAFEKLAALVPQVEKALGHPLDFVDLGGGLGIRYEKETPPSITAYCQLIKKFFGKTSPFKGRLKVILEPGRTLAGNAGILVTEVLYRKEGAEKDFLIVDAAMNDFIRPTLYKSHHEIEPIVEKHSSTHSERLYRSDIVGPVCESGDFFAKNRKISKDIQRGDLLALFSTGAYGMSMASQYNSRPRPAEVLVTGRRFQLIRRRERFADLILGESIS